MLVNAQGRLRRARGGQRAGPRAPGTDGRQRPVSSPSMSACSGLPRKRSPDIAPPWSPSIRATATSSRYVSTPMFDPNGFARGLTVPEYAALQGDIDKPLYDRAMRGVYPPGSTIKPLVALAALEIRCDRARDDASVSRGVPAAGLESPVPRLEKGRARHDRHAPGDRAVVRRVLLRCRELDGHRSPARFPHAVRARIRDRHRHRRRAHGARAVARVEEAGVQAPGARRSGSRARP